MGTGTNGSRQHLSASHAPRKVTFLKCMTQSHYRLQEKNEM